jgi:hypothetical protein
MASDVTVITCTIPERETMLEECKASVAAQTHPPADHLIFRDTWHKGIQVGLNRLWPKVETEWLQWLADDDLLLPHHLEALEPYMPDADIIFWRKAGAHGARFAVHRQPTWVYRFHGENASFKPHRYVGP